jgi:hypothetical protein
LTALETSCIKPPLTLFSVDDCFFSFYSKDKEESLITVSAISDVECITSMLIVLLCFLVFATMIVLRFGQESTLYVSFLPHKPPLLLYLQFIQQLCQDNI